MKIEIFFYDCTIPSLNITGIYTKHEHTLFKKIYYYNESCLLAKYEQLVAKKVKIIAVSEKDVNTYETKFGAARIWHLPVFIPYSQIKTEEGLGTFCLYHGNLSVSENEKAAIWLLENVFHQLKIPFVIAGKKPFC